MRKVIYVGVGEAGKRILNDLAARFEDLFSEPRFANTTLIRNIQLLALVHEPEASNDPSLSDEERYKVHRLVKTVNLAMSDDDFNALPADPEIAPTVPRLDSSDVANEEPFGQHEPYTWNLKGRLLLIGHHQRISAEFDRMVRTLRSINEVGMQRTSTVQYYLVGSLAEALFTSVLIDLSYLMRDFLNNLDQQGRLTPLHLILLSPDEQSYETGEAQFVHFTRARMYAALREIEYYLAGGAYSLEYDKLRVPRNGRVFKESPLGSNGRVYAVAPVSQNGTWASPTLIATEWLFQEVIAEVEQFPAASGQLTDNRPCQYYGFGISSLSVPVEELRHNYQYRLASELLSQYLVPAKQQEEVNTKRAQQLITQLRLGEKLNQIDVIRGSAITKVSTFAPVNGITSLPLYGKPPRMRSPAEAIEYELARLYTNFLNTTRPPAEKEWLKNQHTFEKEVEGYLEEALIRLLQDPNNDPGREDGVLFTYSLFDQMVLELEKLQRDEEEKEKVFRNTLREQDKRLKSARKEMYNRVALYSFLMRPFSWGLMFVIPTLIVLMVAVLPLQFETYQALFVVPLFCLMFLLPLYARNGARSAVITFAEAYKTTTETRDKLYFSHRKQRLLTSVIQSTRFKLDRVGGLRKKLVNLRDNVVKPAYERLKRERTDRLLYRHNRTLDRSVLRASDVDQFYEEMTRGQYGAIVNGIEPYFLHRIGAFPIQDGHNNLLIEWLSPIHSETVILRILLDYAVDQRINPLLVQKSVGKLLNRPSTNEDDPLEEVFRSRLELASPFIANPHNDPRYGNPPHPDYVILLNDHQDYSLIKQQLDAQIKHDRRDTAEYHRMIFVGYQRGIAVFSLHDFEASHQAYVQEIQARPGIRALLHSARHRIVTPDIHSDTAMVEPITCPITYLPFTIPLTVALGRMLRIIRDDLEDIDTAYGFYYQSITDSKLGLPPHEEPLGNTPEDCVSDLYSRVDPDYPDQTFYEAVAAKVYQAIEDLRIQPEYIATVAELGRRIARFVSEEGDPFGVWLKNIDFADWEARELTEYALAIVDSGGSSSTTNTPARPGKKPPASTTDEDLF